MKAGILLFILFSYHFTLRSIFHCQSRAEAVGAPLLSMCLFNFKTLAPPSGGGVYYRTGDNEGKVRPSNINPNLEVSKLRTSQSAPLGREA